ncbi:MAG: ester cyclase [Thermoleophilia bacterium]|nr:ester cyclase [Thermoleophilia bacterium]
MSTERNKVTERRIIAELNAGNIDVVDELFAPGFTYHLAGMPPQGREDFKQLLGMTYSAFPDWHMTEDDMIAEGDKVVTRATDSGTHLGTFLGISPTGKPFKYSKVLIARFENSKEVESWEVFDNMSLLRQLDALPPLGGLAQI